MRSSLWAETGSASSVGQIPAIIHKQSDAWFWSWTHSPLFSTLHPSFNARLTWVSLPHSESGIMMQNEESRSKIIHQRYEVWDKTSQGHYGRGNNTKRSGHENHPDGLLIKKMHFHPVFWFLTVHLSSLCLPQPQLTTSSQGNLQMPPSISSLSHENICFQIPHFANN